MPCRLYDICHSVSTGKFDRKTFILAPSRVVSSNDAHAQTWLRNVNTQDGHREKKGAKMEANKNLSTEEINWRRDGTVNRIINQTDMSGGDLLVTQVTNYLTSGDS
ncbi:hypothetical protein J6590_070977 [Homalodisca vitripennis]|nr:hypothetical protein J6590_070977 [Homalodisca vitripennis]